MLASLDIKFKEKEKKPFCTGTHKAKYNVVYRVWLIVSTNKSFVVSRSVSIYLIKYRQSYAEVFINVLEEKENQISSVFFFILNTVLLECIARRHKARAKVKVTS